MRKALVSALCELAEKDKRLVLLTGDLGFMVLEPFIQRYPDKFFNAGVAEQNMVGMATGLAEAGFRPYAYSITPFLALRALEFIRNGPVLHRLPVRLVGVGAGFDYGHAGPTHHGTEDVGALGTLRGLSVVIPADHQQARAAVLSMHEHPGPVYFSLGKSDQDVIPGLNGRFELSKPQLVREGTAALIVGMGAVTVEALAAASELAKTGVSCAVAVVSSLAPSPVAELARLMSAYPVAVTVEAHVASGGLGAAACTAVATSGLRCRVVTHCVTQPEDGRVGSHAWYWQRHGLDRGAIARSVLSGIAQCRS